MASLESTKVIRRLAGKNATIFNDQLVDGRRSYKIWGWTLLDYEVAASELRSKNFVVDVVMVYGYSSRAKKQYAQPRLHVEVL